MSPSLGWLKAFLAVAAHNDYERAATDLGINADRAKLRVEKLELWLRKVLILDGPTELSPVDGTAFIAIAGDMLAMIEAAYFGADVSGAAAPNGKRAEVISKLRLHDLERFLAVADMGDFKGAADVARCNVTTVQRSIRDLEKVTGTKLLSGRSMLALSDDGAKFRETAQVIVDALNGFRAQIPDDYNAARENAKRVYDCLKVRRMELLSMKLLVENTGKRQRGKVRLADVEQSLQVVTDMMARIEQAEDPFAAISGLDVSVSGLVVGPPADHNAGN